MADGQKTQAQTAADLLDEYDSQQGKQKETQAQMASRLLAGSQGKTAPKPKPKPLPADWGKNPTLPTDFSPGQRLGSTDLYDNHSLPIDVANPMASVQVPISRPTPTPAPKRPVVQAAKANQGKRLAPPVPVPSPSSGFSSANSSMLDNQIPHDPSYDLFYLPPQNPGDVPRFLTDQNTGVNQPPQWLSDRVELLNRAAGTNAFPMVAGGLASSGIGLLTENPLLIMGGGVATGIGAGMLQNYVAPKVVGQDNYDQFNARTAQLAQQYPVTNFVGNQIPAMLMAQPANPFTARGLISGGLNAGINAGMRAIEGQPQNPLESFGDFASGAVFSGDSYFHRAPEPQPRTMLHGDAAMTIPNLVNGGRTGVPVRPPVMPTPPPIHTPLIDHFANENTDVNTPSPPIDFSNPLVDTHEAPVPQLPQNTAQISAQPAAKQSGQPEPWQVTRAQFISNRKKPAARSEESTVADLTNDLQNQKGQPGVSQEASLFEGHAIPGMTTFVYRNETGDPVGALRIFHDPNTNAVDLRTVAVDPAYRKQGIATLLYNVADNAGFDTSPSTAEAYTEAGAGVAHKRSVTKALAEGKQVPAEVLADYPNLKPQTPQAQSPTETVPQPTETPQTPQTVASNKPQDSTPANIAQSGRQLNMDSMEAEAARLGVQLPDRESFRQTWDQDREDATANMAQYLADIRDTPKEQAGRLTRGQRVAGHMALVHMAENDFPRVQQAMEDALNSGDTAAIDRVGAEMSALTDRYGDIASKVYRAGSDAGRGLALQRMFQGPGLETGKWLEKAEAIKGKPLSAEARSVIVEGTQRARNVQEKLNQRIDTDADAAARRVKNMARQPTEKVFSLEAHNDALTRLKSVDFRRANDVLEGQAC